MTINSWSRWLGASVLLAVLLGVGGCVPTAQPSPAPVPVKPAESAAPPTDWQADWERTLAAARQEGKVVLSAPTGQLWREVLLTFEKDYPGIALEATGGNSRDFWPRLFQERAAGQYLWDLRVGGPDPEVFQARDEGMLAPVRPLLVLPEVVDESKWFGGFESMYADRDKQYLPAFVAQVSHNAHVNRDMTPEADLRSEEQLVEPRWRGRIVMQDPRGGAGLGTLTTFLASHGEEYVRGLLANQEVVITNDNRQQAEWLVRRRYPIAIGLRTDQVLVFEQQGLVTNVKGLGSPKKLSLGSGGIQLIDRAPHPNATKVFINWLLTQQVQERIAKSVQVNSRRLDVPPGDPEEVPDAQRMHEYVPHQYEDYLPTRRRAQALATELVR